MDARSSKQKAAVFAEYLENVFKSNRTLNSNEDPTFIHKIDQKKIPLVTLKEVRNTIIFYNLSAKKAPGYDLITEYIMKELTDIALYKLQYLINACFKLKYVPHLWKSAEVIIIPKPGKEPTEVTSYRPISLLPILLKIFEKLLLKRLIEIIKYRKLILAHQFRFRNKHSTIDQVHRITDIIENALEGKKVCAAVFFGRCPGFR